MFFFEKITGWWRQFNAARELNNIPTKTLEQRDLGIKVTRIRLPSGYEILIIEMDDDE